MRRSVPFCAVTLLVIQLIVPTSSAGECCYGSVHAWFQGSNGRWQNATAHPVLKPGDVFQIKIIVSPTTMCQAFIIKLHEFGTPVYEVLAGPMQFEELLENRGKIQVNQPYTYQWTVRVRPTTTWTYGSAPFEVFTQFNRNDSEECRIDFDVIVASILPGVQAGSEEAHQAGVNHPSDSHPGRYFPGFQWEVFFIAVVVLCMLIYSKQRWFGRE